MGVMLHGAFDLLLSQFLTANVISQQQKRETDMFKPIDNDSYDTSPIFEALVGQKSYVGIWACASKADGAYYEIDYNLVGYMSAEDKAKTHPPRHVEVGSGWFEDHMSRAEQRKPTAYAKTFAEAMQLVMDDIAEHNLQEHDI